MTVVLLSTQGIPPAAMPNYYAWRRRIRDENESPNMAATNVAALNYQALSGGRNQFEIRLNQHHRATFTVDDAGRFLFSL